MYLAGAGGLAAGQISRAELAALGFRLIVDPTTPFLAMHNALRYCYAALAGDKPDPLLGTDAGKEQAIVHQTIDLEAMLEIERQTVEK
jgi:2-methylisocitrate lyase-like PEP mutase family enzyme